MQSLARTPNRLPKNDMLCNSDYDAEQFQAHSSFSHDNKCSLHIDDGQCLAQSAGHCVEYLCRLAGSCLVGRQHLHLNAGPGASVQATLDGVCQSSILDRVKGNAVAWICDSMHLLDEGQG